MKRTHASTHIPAPLEQSEAIERISIEDFAKYLPIRRPFVVAGGAADWSARHRWSLDYFAKRGRNIPVLLECGNIMQGTTRFEASDLATYIGTIREPRVNPADQAYLSIFELFESMPDLRQDVNFECLTSGRAKQLLLGWIGPAGTVTGLHADYPDNLVAQIYGRKLFHFIAPEQSCYLYQSAKYEFGIRISGVDLRRFDPQRWPLFEHAEIRHALLEPGDLLYIPSRWWHHVEALDPSISVNCFAPGWGQFLYHETLELFRAGLHRLGWLGRDHCTCHGYWNGRRIARKELARQALRSAAARHNPIESSQRNAP